MTENIKSLEKKFNGIFVDIANIEEMDTSIMIPIVVHDDNDFTKFYEYVVRYIGEIIIVNGAEGEALFFIKVENKTLLKTSRALSLISVLSYILLNIIAIILVFFIFYSKLYL